MKKMLLTCLAIILFATLLGGLSGCGLFKEKNEDKSTEPTEPVEVTADTILDGRLLENAINSGDLEMCEEITDSTKKEECVKVIEADRLTSEAIEKMDESLCGKIKLERYKENCETIVEKKLKLKTEDTDRLKLQQEAYDKKDYTICDKIEDENQKSSCKFDVITELAKENPSLCEEIGEEMLVDKCKSSVAN
ncbi:MAG: hypothetical protein WC604_01615 [Candidatus Gracilibacteria bacterium]